MEDFIDFKCPYINNNEIWEKVEKFRKDYWPDNTIPVDIEKIIEQKLNLYIEAIPGLKSNYYTDAYLSSDFTRIIVDHHQYMDDRYINRLRFSFAHEIGHLILHKDIYQRFRIINLESWRNFYDNVSTKEYKRFEVHANEFAGRLLVPIETLKILFKTNHLNNDLDITKIKSKSELCIQFGVSSVVIQNRVKIEGLWPPQHY